MASSYHSLFVKFHCFVVPLGWDFMLDLVTVPTYEEESEWLLRWLTAGETLEVHEVDYTRLVTALSSVGSELLEIYGFQSSFSDNLSEHSFYSCDELAYLDEEIVDEGEPLGLPQGLYHTLLPRERDMGSHAGPSTSVLPFGLVSEPRTFERFFCDLRDESS